ncbi:MAG: hypothetical protein FKY71_05110 [Spiribacter salinus]|uniref:Uncharacterized protein n=1 Tax=Spiribacter salinus TaxID=1335746 RepID=A0A540VTT0_9GAMM|nr:MAG: hypothetical protein FKY71_05110 [Spiribacter salinus]
MAYRRASVFSSYLSRLLILFTAALAALMAWNLVVDPYGVWRVVEVAGFNDAKSERRDQNYLFKAVDLARPQSGVLLLGSSRVAFGLSPEVAEALEGGGSRAYNAALTGGHMAALEAYVDHALGNGAPVHTVVWGVDFFAFERDMSLPPVFKRSRLNGIGMDLDDLLFTLTSVDTAMAGYRTVVSNRRDSDYEPYFDNGQLTAMDMAQEVARVGMVDRFRRSLDLYGNGRFRRYESSPGHWETFDDILETLRGHGVEVLLFVPPTHVAHLEALRQRGLWDDWAAFKQALARRGGYWDFSGVNNVTAEPIQEEMAYYWDISHFRSAVGDRILQRLLASPEADTGFGRWVGADNVAEHVRAQSLRLERWRRQNPEAADFVAEQLD